MSDGLKGVRVRVSDTAALAQFADVQANGSANKGLEDGVKLPTDKTKTEDIVLGPRERGGLQYEDQDLWREKVHHGGSQRS